MAQLRHQTAIGFIHRFRHQFSRRYQVSISDCLVGSKYPRTAAHSELAKSLSFGDVVFAHVRAKRPRAAACPELVAVRFHCD
jgi:hypothetical protein